MPGSVDSGRIHPTYVAPSVRAFELRDFHGISSMAAPEAPRPLSGEECEPQQSLADAQRWCIAYHGSAVNDGSCFQALTVRVEFCTVLSAAHGYLASIIRLVRSSVLRWRMSIILSETARAPTALPNQGPWTVRCCTMSAMMARGERKSLCIRLFFGVLYWCRPCSSA